MKPPRVSWWPEPISHSQSDFFSDPNSCTNIFWFVPCVLPQYFFSIYFFITLSCLILLGRASLDSIKFHYGNGGLGTQKDQRGCLFLIPLLLLQYSQYTYICCMVAWWVWVHAIDFARGSWLSNGFCVAYSQCYRCNAFFHMHLLCTLLSGIVVLWFPNIEFSLLKTHPFFFFLHIYLVRCFNEKYDLKVEFINITNGSSIVMIVWPHKQLRVLKLTSHNPN